MYKEMSERVVSFNTKAGVVDQKPFTQEWWTAIQLQSKLLVEESAEAFDAANEQDKKELLDGYIDNLVIAFKGVDMLEKAGYNVREAFMDICDNNDSKVFNDYNEVVTEKDKLEARDNQVYTVSEATLDGVPYYSIRREDGKVVKKVGFASVDLSKYIPE